MSYKFVVTYRNLKNDEVGSFSCTINTAGSASSAKYEAEDMFKTSMSNKGLKLGVDYVIVSTM